MSFTRILIVSILLVGLSDLVAHAAPPEQARKPDCALTGGCDHASRDVVICNGDVCRVAPPNWIDVVLDNGSGNPPGGYAPPSDPAIISLPRMGFALLLGLGLLFGLRIRA